ncbi:MAG: transcription initiation factor IIB family protein [Nitrososphaerales archaeon]
MAKAIQANSCTWCRKGILILDVLTGEEVCNACGIVLGERREQGGPEWRTFSLDDYIEKKRTGDPFTLSVFDKGLSTQIGSHDADASGRPLPSGSGVMLKRLRTWDYRLQLDHSRSRNLREAFTQLDALTDKLGLGKNTREQAAYIYRKSLKKGLVRGRSISSVLVAALYLACRMARIPRSVKEICDAANLRKRELTRTYRLIVNALDLKMPVQDVKSYLPCIANNLGLEVRVERKAFQIINRARRKNILGGKDLRGIAASALYLASCLGKQTIPQKKIADEAGITEVTIRNSLKTMKQVLRKRELAILEKAT